LSKIAFCKNYKCLPQPWDVIGLATQIFLRERGEPMLKVASLFSKMFGEISRVDFQKLVVKHGAEHHSKSFRSWQVRKKNTLYLNELGKTQMLLSLQYFA
jgi:hypothetical protein